MIDRLPLVQVSASAILALVVIMVLTGRLVPRRTLEAVEADRDHWREIALRGLGVAEQSTAHAEALVLTTASEESTP